MIYNYTYTYDDKLNEALADFAYYGNNDVLTIFVMPQVCEKETEAIYKYVETAFVEITPENASGERARKYLSYKAKKLDIAFHVPFEDYSTEELVEITKLIAKNRKNRLCDDVIAKLGDIFEKAVKIKDFGNGRYARNIIEKAELNRASRLAKLSFDEVTSDMLETFIPEDFEVETTHKTERKKIGFV